MELLMFGVVFLIGVVTSRLLFGGVTAGPFEESLMANLRAGKKVIVTIDEDCFIFEMYGNRMRITRGVATFSEEPYELKSDNLVSIDLNKFGDDNKLGG